MSLDRRPDQGAPAQPRADRQPIAVRTLWFKGPRDVPGKSVATSLSAEFRPNRARWSIEFKPWMRCFTVSYRPPGEEKPIVRNLHEAGVDWEPLDG